MSSYPPGVSGNEPEIVGPDETRPIAQTLGQDGNVFALMSIASQALWAAGLSASEMPKRVFDAGSYGEALAIMAEYVDIE